MVDTTLLPAIKAAIQANEIGDASPYVLSFAGLGTSGASFGIFQGDTNTNPTARATLRQVLQACDVAGVDAIMAAVSQPCPNGNPLPADQTQAVNAALDGATGRPIVDAMDDTLLNVVLGYIDDCAAAAATVTQTIAPEAQLYIALWVNMTGAPTTLKRWLSGTVVEGLAPPAGPVVSAADMQAYLQKTQFFTQNPRNFTHMQQSVAAGTAQLPTA